MVKPRSSAMISAHASQQTRSSVRAALVRSIGKPYVSYRFHAAAPGMTLSPTWFSTIFWNSFWPRACRVSKRCVQQHTTHQGLTEALLLRVDDGLDGGRVAAQLGEGVAEDGKHGVDQRLEEVRRCVQLLLAEADGAAQNQAQDVAASGVVGAAACWSQLRRTGGARGPSEMAMVSVRMWSATTRYAVSTPSASSAPTLPVYGLCKRE